MVLNKFPLEHLDIEKEINPYYSNWRDNYYKIAFNMSNIDDNKNKIIKNYLESILWTFKYYFLNITNWEWFYRFNYGPTVNDIVIYLKNNKEIKKRKEVTFNINKLTFNKSKPIKAEELLLMVLPMESKELFPKNVKLDKIKHYFPKNIFFTTIYNTYFWQCKPILPIVDYNDIKKSIK